MNQFYDVLKQIVSDHHLNFSDGDSVFTTLYEAYSNVITFCLQTPPES